jgi:hypothetical protein
MNHREAETTSTKEPQYDGKTVLYIRSKLFSVRPKIDLAKAA